MRAFGQRTASAFTLIELLVVVSIIAQLISILLPSLGRAREQAKAVVCSSNMHSLMLAVHLYANNHEDRLITAGLAHGGSEDEHAAWINTLRTEYGNREVARCPSDDSKHWTVPVPGTTSLRRTSYGTNYYTVKEIGGKGPYNRLSMLRNTSSVILLVEIVEEGDFGATDHVHPESWFFNPRAAAAQEMELERHLGRANYAFMDGHVERLQFDETYLLDPEGGFPPRFLVNKYDPAIAGSPSGASAGKKIV